MENIKRVFTQKVILSLKNEWDGEILHKITNKMRLKYILYLSDGLDSTNILLNCLNHGKSIIYY